MNKMKKNKIERSHCSQVIFKIQQEHYISWARNNPLWPETHLCGSAALLGVISPFLQSVACICSWAALSAFFLWIGNTSLLSLHLPSVLLGQSWQCFCWYNILKNLVVLLCVSWGFIPLNNFLHRSFLDYYIPISAFSWDGRGNPWITHLISSKSPMCDWILCHFVPSGVLARDCPTRPLLFLQGTLSLQWIS